MPVLTNWTTTAANRAEDAWLRIQDKPTVITMDRAGVTLAAQTVRLEYDSSVTRQDGDVSGVAVQRVVVFGVTGHPTVTNTDMQRGDRFWANDSEYEIDSIIPTLGEVQGIGRRIT